MPELDKSAPIRRNTLFPFAALSASYFAHIGFFNPYLPLWLKSLGFSISTIGLLTGVQALTRVLAPYGWGWLSDHSANRISLLRFCAAAALVCAVGLFFQWGLLWLALVLLFMFIHTSAMMPMSEAALAQWVSNQGTFNTKRYGRIRLWGSIGFLVTVLVAGAWFDHLGLESFPAWAVGSLVAINISVWWLPQQAEVIHQDTAPEAVLSVLRQAKVRWFFVTVFFHVFAHIGIYVYLSLYLDALGYSKTMIGILWAVSVATEIVWFFTQSKWLPIFNLSTWLVICSGVMVVRMCLTTWWSDVVLVLLLAQMLHAVTFASHHTVCISILSKHFPGRLRGRGQALYASIGYGAPGVLGAYLGGLLSDSFGLRSIYTASLGVALVACLCAWRTYYLSQKNFNLLDGN